MKKKSLYLLIAIIMLFGIVVFAGCNSDENSVYGKYFEWNSQGKITANYIELKKDNSWSDESGGVGRFELDGNVLKIYIEEFGEEILWEEITIKNGTIKIDGTIYYYEGTSPEIKKPNESDKPVKPNPPIKDSTKYEVCFDTNGGTGIANLYVDKNGVTLSMPSKPKKEGYKFTGWYKNSCCGTKWDFRNDKINKDTTLYAGWIKNVIYFEDNGHNIVEAKGYESNGSNFKTKVSNSQSDYSFLKTIKVAKNAKWKVCQDEYGQGEYVSKTMPLKKGDNIVYLFVESEDGNQISSYKVNVRRKKIYSVMFYDGENHLKTEHIEEDDIVDFYNYEKTGYTLTNYEVYHDYGFEDDYIFNFQTTITESLLLKAVWEAKSYNVTLKSNNSSDEKIETSLKFNTAINLPLNTFKSDDNLEFVAWCEDKNGVGEYFTNDDNYWLKTEGATLYAIWQDSNYSKNLEYNLVDKGYEVLSIGTCKDENITFPQFYKGKKIVSIGDNAFEGANLRNITIPETVTSIGERAFYECNLLKLPLTQNVSYIGNAAFSHNNFKTINIPEGVTYIGDFAFSSCDNLISITIPNNVINTGAKLFYDCNNLSKIFCEADYKLNSWNYDWNKTYDHKLYKVVGISTIWKMDLSNIIWQEDLQYYLNKENNTAKVINCGYCASYIIPNEITVEDINYTVTDIEYYSFCNRKELTNIIIPSSVINIDNYAFKNYHIKNIYCEKESAPIGWDEYWNVSNNYNNKILVKWNINCSDFVWKDGLFYKLNKDDFTASILSHDESETQIIPSEIAVEENTYVVTSIGEEAFYNYDNLKYITLSTALTLIGSKAFYDCDGLTHLIIPQNVTSIRNQIFEDCRNLKSVYCEVDSKPDGWHKYWSGIDLLIIDNIVVWEAEWLEFDSQGGSFVFAIAGQEGDAISLPSEPIKDGYSFAGWYTDNKCTSGNEYTIPSNLPNDNITLYAKWIEG